MALPLPAKGVSLPVVVKEYSNAAALSASLAESVLRASCADARPAIQRSRQADAKMRLFIALLVCVLVSLDNAVKLCQIAHQNLSGLGALLRAYDAGSLKLIHHFT